MNVTTWRDNYIDATNTFIGGGGEGGTGSTGDITINTNTSNNNLSDYINTSNESSNVHLYIKNPNTYGDIRFANLYTLANPTRNHNVKIDYFGKLYVYHPYNLANPTVLEGWKDVESEIAGLIFDNQVNLLEIGVVQGQIAGIDVAISEILGELTSIQAYTRATTANLEALQYGFFNIDDYNEFVTNTALNLIPYYSSRIQTFASVAFNTRVNQFIFGAGIPIAVGAVLGFFANHIDTHNLHFAYSNALSSNPNVTQQERNEILAPTSNMIRDNYISFNSNFSNMTLQQGFINSNIITTQFVPSLKSNKILLGNITTPNSSYQMEMTGDMNANEYYRNSTSLTSLLAQKQDNISVTAPIYFTTGNIGLLYDNSLTKIGNNLSVVKTASAPLRWSTNNLVLDYDSTLINNSGNLGVSIAAESKWAFTGGNIYNKAKTNVGIGTDSGLTYKLNVVGDSYFSSNVNIATSKLNFISAYSGQSAFGLVTGTNEYYIEFNSGGGTLILNEPCAADILLVGAGGNGGVGASSGGGGAGEVIYYPNFPLRSGTLNIQVGASSTNTTNRISRVYPTTGNEVIRALGGGNGGSPYPIYSTSGGTNTLTLNPNTNDANLIFTSGTSTLTLNVGVRVDILVVGGGGGGGSFGGGGGAGQVLYTYNVELLAGNYTITVGAGGAGSSTSTANGSDGNDSSIVISGVTYTAKGGGGGGTRRSDAGAVGRAGNAGGSGGGGSHSDTVTVVNVGGVSNKTTYSGWYSLGYSGGEGKDNDTANGYGHGGGGGAGGVGGNGLVNGGGNGGLAVDMGDSFTSAVGHQGRFGGGGGGTGYGGTGGTIGYGNGGNGNLGGGGNGGINANGVNGLANTGGGGGGGDLSRTGGTGGSGVVILRIINYSILALPASGGSGGGGAKTQTGAVAGVKFDEYKSFVQAGLNGTSTNGGNGGSGSSLYNTRFTTTITGTSLSVGLGGSGVGASPASPATKTNYGDGGDGNGGVGAGGIVIIRFKEASSHLQLKAIKDNANTGLILNANETISGTTTPYQLRIFPWSDTYTTTGITTRGWSFRTHDGLANQDLINLFSYFGGRVGIKTKNPTATFDVNGDIRCKTFFINGVEQYGVACQITNEHITGEASINITAGASGNFGGCGITYIPADNLGLISCSKSLKIKTGNDAANGYIYLDYATGNFGIGMNNPSSKLEVNGTTTTNYLSAVIVYAGEVQANIINNGNGNIVNNNNLFTSNIYVYNAIDMQNKPINNCSYLYGGVSWANELKAYTNYYHKDDQGRDRIYFKNDTTGSPPNHFTLFKSGGTTHSFSDKDDVQYCLLDRFGITTYFEVISGGGYDNLGVLDGVSTGTYVFRKMYLRLSTFTEVHRAFIEDDLYINYDDFINEFVGRVVVSKGKIKTALKEADKDWEILEGRDGITIDDSHPVVELSRKKKDKAVVGVITKRNQNSDMPGRLVINSLGETAIWVVNSGGNIENGDLITTSDKIGYGEKQDCDFIKNYTIGKCMIDCCFELDNPNYKCEDLDNGLRRAFLPIFIYSG